MNIDETTAKQLYEKVIARAQEVSNGKLRAFEVGSPLNALLEAVALAGGEVSAIANKVTSTLEKNRLLYFGLARTEGTFPVGTIGVELDGLYPDNFILPSGYRFSNGSQTYETNADLVIAPYQSSSSVTVTSTSVGSSGNRIDSLSYSAVSRVARFFWVELPNGGQDPESDKEWRDRIYQTLQRRNTLISSNDFEEEARSSLGAGSKAIAVGRLKPDRTSYENGYVCVFCLLGDNSAPSDAQLSTLAASFNAKAAMALVSVFAMNAIAFNVDAVIGINEERLPSEVGAEIKAAIEQYFAQFEPGATVLPKAIEYRIQKINGVIEGNISVLIDNLAQAAPLSNPWSVAKLGTATITLIRNGVEFPV